MAARRRRATMGLLATALSDRARVVRRIATGPRVEGSRQTAEVTDDYFPCRVVEAPSREARDGRGSVRLVQQATLVCQTDDVRATDEVEVNSRTAGDARWRVSGEPTTIRHQGRTATVISLERL